MQKLIASLGAAALAFTFAAGNAVAQEKKASKGARQAVIKVLAENDKVRVTETTYAPGAENKTSSRAVLRVVRALKGGTLERTYDDGKKEKVSYKAGQVRINEPGPNYVTKNTGKSEVKLYIVTLK